MHVLDASLSNLYLFVAECIVVLLWCEWLMKEGEGVYEYFSRQKGMVNVFAVKCDLVAVSLPREALVSLLLVGIVFEIVLQHH